MQIRSRTFLAPALLMVAQLVSSSGCSNPPTCDSATATCADIDTCTDSCGNKGDKATGCAAKKCNPNGTASDTCGNPDSSCGTAACDASTATCTSASTCTDSCGNTGSAATACASKQCKSDGTAFDSCGNADSSCPGAGCQGLNNCKCTDGTCATANGSCDDGFECSPCNGGCVCTDGTCASSSGTCDDGTECATCPHLPSSCLNASNTVDTTDCPCGTGLTCNGSGMCVPMTCGSSSDCPNGFTCDTSGFCNSPIYAEVRHHPEPKRIKAFAVTAQAPVKVPFRWHDAPGIPAPADLSVEIGGHAVLQVSSMGSRPFARAGLDVALLDADAPYVLLLSQNDRTVTMKIARTDAAGTVVFQVSAPADGASTNADVVLPEVYMRPAVTLGLAQ